MYFYFGEYSMTTPSTPMQILSVQTTSSTLQNGTTFAPIAGLQLTLPEGETSQHALMILNVPNPWALGDDYPGGQFGIVVDGVQQKPYATFTYEGQAPQPPGCPRVPTTLVVTVPLKQQAQVVKAYWAAIRNGTVNLDTPATLSAIII